MTSGSDLIILIGFGGFKSTVISLLFWKESFYLDLSVTYHKQIQTKFQSFKKVEQQLAHDMTTDSVALDLFLFHIIFTGHC